MKKGEFKVQLLKWIGNKQRFAHEIISYFPDNFNCFYEPFFGSGAVTATLMPSKGIGSDVFPPLMEIWSCLKSNPETIKDWYRTRWEFFVKNDKKVAYENIKLAYNENPNGADLLFLSRTCYGGVMRFRKKDGYMSTPCGAHAPITPESFAKRVDIWRERLANVSFMCCDYKKIFSYAQRGDLIYCDPPYMYSQSILYRGQNFSFDDLISEITKAKQRGVYIALSIDGIKKSGSLNCHLPIPTGLFKQELFVNTGKSMLKRFQMGGMTLEKEYVCDRLLLTY